MVLKRGNWSFVTNREPKFANQGLLFGEFLNELEEGEHEARLSKIVPIP